MLKLTRRLPKSFDWRSRNVLRKVQTSKPGWCVPYAVTSAVESAHAILYGRFSEPPLCPSAKEFKRLIHPKGGMSFDTFLKHASTRGIPYLGSAKHRYKIYGYGKVKEDHASVLAAVTRQPLIAAMVVGPNFQHYRRGIYWGEDRATFSRASKMSSHAIEIVGYSLDETLESSYLIIRNNCGESWGVNGYAYVALNTTRYTGILGDVHYPIINKDSEPDNEASISDDKYVLAPVGKRVIHSGLTEKKLAEVKTSLDIDAMEVDGNETHNKTNNAAHEARAILLMFQQELRLKFSQSEVDNKESSRKLQLEIQRKQEEIDTLQKEIATHEQHVDSLEKQLSQLHSVVEEKERIIIIFKDREKQLEDQQAEIQKLLAESESNVAEARKQYDQMLESKQLELSRHLKEISQKNDQAINDIRRKYEVEKEECISLQKEKAEELVIDMEKKCDQKLAERKEESKQQLLQIEGENATLIRKMQQENEQKEAHLISNHREELKCVQLQTENELRELLKNKHEAELRDLCSQHEEDCRHLEEELNIQKSKEERQRALLQLQWKVMGAEPQEDQEVTSKKNYSTSNKLRKSDGADRSHSAVVRREDDGKDLPSLKPTQTPVSNLLRKVQKGNAGSVVSIPKHSKKVTQHEYEVETAHGRTIKHRKTKSTIMFEDPTKNKKRQTPKANTPGDVKGIKGGSQRKPANLGDLFSEGSLNPYADDPHAFD